VVFPTPQRAPTGSAWRNGSVSAAGTTSRPSGLQRVLASLATNLVEAAPTEQVRPVSACTRRRIMAPISAGEPKSPRAPATSRNASSMLSGSTSGVTSRKMPMTTRDQCAYFSMWPPMTVACGQSRSACAMGMAERTPKRLAS
jgi:hypothetical protein